MEAAELHVQQGLQCFPFKHETGLHEETAAKGDKRKNCAEDGGAGDARPSCAATTLWASGPGGGCSGTADARAEARGAPLEEATAAVQQKTPTDTQMSPEDAGRGAHERLDYRTSKKKPMQMSTEEISAATSMVAGEAGSSSPEALQAEKNLNGEAADAFGQFRAEDSQKKRSGDAQMSFEDAAALALLTAEKPAGKTEAPQVETSGNTEAPQVETSATKDSACDTDGWDYDNFWAHIDVNLPPHLASAKIFAAMGISGDSAGITVAPAMPRSNMPNEDPFMGFWDKIDANMSPELVATKLLNAHFVKAY